MEAILQEVIVELTAQAITRAAGPIGRAVGALKPAKAPDWLTSSLSPSVTAAVRAMLAEQSPSWLSEPIITKAAEALRSPQAQQLQRSLVVSIITQNQINVSNLVSQLTAIITYLGGCAPADAERIALPLASVLLSSAMRSVEIFQSNSSKYYGVVRQLALQEQAAGAIENLVATTKVPYQVPTPEDLAEVHQFARTYVQEMIARNADLVPQHFDMQTRVPLDELYVAPHFQAVGDEVARLMPMNKETSAYAPEVTFPFAHAMRRMYRAVVLGSPGAGKTTLTQKIIHDLCNVPDVGNICVPFLITLRKYDQFRQENPPSYVEYLAEYITSQLQIPVAQKTIHYLLTSGNAMIIFDGLDELLRLDRRLDLIHSIESFGRRYPSISILVTSRIIGYERAVLDRKVFLHMRLANFDDESVITYVRNWFGLNPVLDPTEQLGAAKSFLRESASVSELRSNPLLLSLMCNIFRGAGYIPQNRADLYERCALMLFEEWDHSRGIDSGGPLRADARYALQDIAFWTLNNSSFNTGIPEVRLRDRLTKFLARTRYGSESMAADAADELLRLWRGRAWILTDLGSDTLHPIYQFTHRTFQEYFAATYLARVSTSANNLWDRLRDKTITGQWEVVAQIAIQAYNGSSVGATDRIYKTIIADVRKEVRGAIDALIFSCRHLDALAPGPRVVKKLVVLVIELIQLTLPCFPTQPKRSDYEVARDLLLNRAELDSPDPVDTGEKIVGQRRDYEEWLPTEEEEDLSIIHMTIRLMNEPLAAVFSSSSLINDLASVAFDDYCKKLINSRDFEAASRGLLLMLAKAQFIQSARYSAGDVEGMAPSNQTSQPRTPAVSSEDLLLALKELPRLSAYNFWLPLVAARYHDIPLVELFAVSGISSLFNAESPFDVAIVGARDCFAAEILKRYLKCNETSQDRAVMKDVARYVRTFYAESGGVPQIEAPWLNDSNIGELVINAYFLNSPGLKEDGGYYDKYFTDRFSENTEPVKYDREPDLDVVFGAAVLLCVISEWEDWNVVDLSADKLASLDFGPVTFLEGLFLCRFSDEVLSAEHLWRRMQLDEKDCTLLVEWSNRELSFLDRRDFYN